MPPKSKAQARAMAAAMAGQGKGDIPPTVAEEYMKGMTKKKYAKLPERAKKKKRAKRR